MKQIGKNVIFQQIQESKFPCWNLYNCTGFRKVLIRSYNCEDLPDDADINKKVEMSLQNLTLALSAYPDDMQCSIEIKANKNASGSSFYGPIEFVNREFELRAPAAETERQSTTMQGLQGWGFPNLGELEKYGLCSQREMDAKLAAIESANAAKLQQMQLEIRKQMLEQEYKQKEAALNAEKTRLDQIRRETTDGINKAVEVVKLAGPPILKAVFGDKVAGMAGMPINDAPAQPATEREKVVEDIASDIFESNLTDEEIKMLKQNIYSLIRKKNETISQAETDNAAKE